MVSPPPDPEEDLHIFAQRAPADISNLTGKRKKKNSNRRSLQRVPSDTKGSLTFGTLKRTWPGHGGEFVTKEETGLYSK